MQFSSDQLDDPLVFDASPDFSGGMASNRSAAQLDPSQYLYGLNIDIKTKLAVTRRGTVTLGAPTPPIGIQGLQWYSTPSLSLLLAVANGALWKWDETRWTQVPGYSAAGGAGAQIGMAQLIGKCYIADAASHLFSWDGVTLADLGTGASNQPPTGNLILSHTNRLWLAGNAAVPDQLTASTALAASWDTQYLSIRIGSGDGDPIVALAPWDDYQIVVFKRKSIYVVAADPVQTTGGASAPLANATVTKITDTIGCAAARSVAVVGSDVWFLCDSGVRSVRRVFAQTQREVSQALSEPIHDYIQRIPSGAIATAAAFFWDNKYLLAVPLDTDSEPGALLVYDTLRQAWAGVWTGWSPAAWALTYFEGAPRLAIGQTGAGPFAGQVLRWLDYLNVQDESLGAFQDGTPLGQISGGLDVPTQLVTRSFTFGDGAVNVNARGVSFTDGFSPKSPFSAEAVFFQSAAAVDLSAAFDQGSPTLLRSQIASGIGQLTLPFVLPPPAAPPLVLNGNQIRRIIVPMRQFNRFREQQLVVASSMNKLSVRSLAGAAFTETIRPEEA